MAGVLDRLRRKLFGRGKDAHLPIVPDDKCPHPPLLCPRALEMKWEVLENAPNRPGLSWRCNGCGRIL